MTPSRPGGLRTGFTTGACAAAAAAAAARALVAGACPGSVEIALPNGAPARFALASAALGGARATCSVVKDAGDDPDATHGAEIVVTVELRLAPGVEIRGGTGVATVTRPGLGLELGTAAINPVPRRHIAAVVAEALAGVGRGALVTVSVPRGEELARRTLNARLGLVGGISILGTTGIVRPFSAAAYGAAVARAVDVAGAGGLDAVVLSTGARSEACAMREHRGFPEEAFVLAGDCVGVALRRAARRGIARVRLYGMIGKLTKLAAGHMQVHASRAEVDVGLLAALAEGAGAPAEVHEALARAATARHALELVGAPRVARLGAALCQRVVERCTAHAGGAVAVSAALVSFEGALLARHPEAA